MWCAATRESAAKSRVDDDSADTFPTVTTFLFTTKDRYEHVVRGYEGERCKIPG